MTTTEGEDLSSPIHIPQTNQKSSNSEEEKKREAMSLIQTIQLEHLPPSCSVHIALFESLKNAEFLQRQLLEGNTEFEYALIDAAVIISRIHILSAAYRAVNDLLENRLRSRNVHSEIVFSLSPNNNIATSFRTLGITPLTTNLLLIKVTTPQTSTTTTPESIQEHISKVIEGDQVPFEDVELGKMTDWARVRKVYKLNGIGGGKKGAVNGEVGENEKRELEVLVLGAMALRGITN